MTRAALTVDFDQTPYAYARRLASYIRDASTIRAHTLNSFGTAPSIESISGLIAEATAQQKARSEHYCGSAAFNDDGSDWRPTGLVQAPVLKLVPPHPPRKRRGETGRDVIRGIAAAYRIPMAEVMGDRKFAVTVRARNAVVYALRKRGNTYSGIARMLGFKDHSAVAYAVRKFEATALDDEWAIVRRFYPVSGE